MRPKSCSLFSLTSILPAQTIITVDAAHPGPDIAPTMFRISSKTDDLPAGQGLIELEGAVFDELGVEAAAGT
jgi:hypothetical protein